MDALYFIGDSKIQIKEIPMPVPNDDEVLLKMKASGICGSDLKNYIEPQASKSIFSVPGHEPVGIVVEIGKNVANVEVGNRVMVHHYMGCLKCSMCRIGFTQMCPTVKEGYGGILDGGHQEYMKVKSYTCIPIPEKLDFLSAAACSCGTGTAFHAIKRLDMTAMDTIAIFGQGPVGLSATMFAAQLGIKVIAIDVMDYRLTLAKDLGADITINSTTNDPEYLIRDLTNGIGADCTLDATGIPNVRLQAVDSAKLWGKVCFVGEGNMTNFDVSQQIIHKQLTIIGSWTFSQSGLAEVANFVTEKNSPMSTLITHTFKLDRAQEAYNTFTSGASGKIIFSID